MKRKAEKHTEQKQPPDHTDSRGSKREQGQHFAAKPGGGGGGGVSRGQFKSLGKVRRKMFCLFFSPHTKKAVTGFLLLILNALLLYLLIQMPSALAEARIAAITCDS